MGSGRVTGAVALALAITACSGGGGGGEGGEGTSAEAGGEAAPADDDRARTLVIAATGTPSGFDGDIFGPDMQPVVVNLNEPLFSYEAGEPQEDGARQIDVEQLQPRLAEGYEVSDDGLTYVVQLREGVTSHRGNEFTAEDVAWSWEKSLYQERTGNTIATISNVEEVVAVDTHTVEFRLSAPSPILVNALTLYVPGIYDSTAAQEHVTDDDPYAEEWLSQNDAYFGAYYVESNEPDQQTVFVRHDDYYGEAPYFERVIWQAVPEPANRATLMETGEVDWMRDAPIEQVEALRDAESVKIQSVVSNEMARALMNANFEPFEDVRVRQAMNLAVDREQILDVVFGGFGEVARQPIPPFFQCATDEYWMYDRDVDRARELLAEAGYPDGIDIELLYSDVRAWEEPMAVQIADTVADAGIRVTLQRLPGDEMTSRSAIGTRDLPFFTYYQNPIVLDPGYSLFLDGHAEGASNRSDWASSEYDALVEEANSTLDADERCELFAQAQQIHMEEAPWLYGIYQDTIKLMKPEIEGWIWHGDQHARWYDLSRTQ